MGENHDNITQWVPLNLNLMIIDEDPTNLKYITAALKACHFGVVSFGNPIEALVQLCVGDKKYDLVLVDLNCTKLPGFYLTKRIVDKFGIPVITMGIEERSNMKNKSYKHGACFHITKPITIMKLDYIWKKVWINRPMRKRSKNNEGASSLSRVENSKEVENTKKKLKLFHVASNFDKNSKVRLLWDSKLNERFQVAITLLDKDATPTNIIAIMNVQGLTTEHIASHLQKYRCKREKEKKKREVQPPVVQLPTSPVHTKSMNTDELKREFFKSMREACSNEEIMQDRQIESTDENYNQKQYINKLSTAMESAPLHNQMNLGFDVQERQEGTAKYIQFVRNLSSAVESAPLHNQMNLAFEHQEESTGQYSQLVNNLSSAMESAPLRNQMNMAFEHQEESTGQYSQLVNNLSSAMECGPLHNQMNLGFEHLEGSTGQYSQLVQNFSRAMESAPLHYQTNLAFEHQEESTGQYSPLMNNLSSAVESAPLHNQINLGFHIQDNIGRHNQQQNVNNLSNAMECGQLHNQMDLSFDYSSFKVPEPAPFLHSNHRLIEPLCNFNVNSTVVQPYIPVMNQNDNVANHQPLLYMDTNDEWNLDELLGSSNAFEAVQHQDASIMSSFHDADMNFNSSFNNYRNMNFDNDSFLEEMFGNAQVGGTD